MNSDLHYTNLEHCEIEISSGTPDIPPSVCISNKVLEQMNAPLPSLYDFSIEKEVLRKAGQQSDETSITSIVERNQIDLTQNLSSYQKSTLKKMKNITNASQERCVSILLKRNFNLNEAIEAYYRGTETKDKCISM